MSQTPIGITQAVAMQRLGSSDRPLAEVFDLALLDLDGVVYVGADAVPGAADAIAAAAVKGLRSCFVTNNASRPADTVSAHLKRLGVPAGVEDVVTSAQVAAALLARRLDPGTRVLVVGGAGLRVALTETGLVPVATMDDGPLAVVQGFSPDLDWRLLAEGTRAVRAGLPWVAANLDLTFPTPHGPAPGSGSFVRLIAAIAGREPDAVAGKPQPQPFLEAARRYGAQRPLVVGDRLDTDLEGACAAQMPGLAVLTGVSGASDLVRARRGLRPTFLAFDLAGLLHPHPAVQTHRIAAGHHATCGSSAVSTVARGLTVAEPGSDALDLLRAACAAAWAQADDAGAAPPSLLDVPGGGDLSDLSGLLSALGRLAPGADWAR